MKRWIKVKKDEKMDKSEKRMKIWIKVKKKMVRWIKMKKG